MSLALRLVPVLLVLASPAAPQDLVINEVLVVNETILADGAGEFDPWVELHNRSQQNLALDGLALVSSHSQADLPAGLVVPRGGFLTLWLDGEVHEGVDHLSLTLAAEGDSLALVSPDEVTPIDAVSFEAQAADESIGRVLDGHPTWVRLLDPSPGASNRAPVGGLRGYSTLDPDQVALGHTMTGDPSIGGGLLVSVSEGSPGQTVWWYLALQPVYVPLQGGSSVLLVDLGFPVIVLPIGDDGEASALWHFPDNPALIGLSIYSQMFDVNGHYRGSPAVEFRIGG